MSVERCAGTTATGKPCSRRPASNSRFCAQHRGVVRSVRDGVSEELEQLARRGVKSPALEATALSLASDIDAVTTSPTAKASCARSLADVMSKLQAAAEPVRKPGGVDQIAAKREQRRAAAG